MSGPLEIIAHRGAAYDAPENTVSAVRLAIQQGADAVEFDIRQTGDGCIVAMHDEDTRRTTGRNVPVAGSTVSLLRALDAGRWKAVKFIGEKVPTLEEMLAAIPAGKRAFIEIKSGLTILPELRRTLQQSGFPPENIVFIAFDRHVAEAAKQQVPGSKALWIVDYKIWLYRNQAPRKVDQLISLCHETHLDGVDLNRNWPLTADGVRDLHAAGLQIYAWTVDDPAMVRKLAGFGVDGITTNRPGWMREQLGPEFSRS